MYWHTSWASTEPTGPPSERPVPAIRVSIRVLERAYKGTHHRAGLQNRREEDRRLFANVLVRQADLKFLRKNAPLPKSSYV